MKLYVANPTTKPHKFLYRVPNVQRDYNQDIGAGKQELIYRADMDDGTLDYIVRQHEPYGMVDASEMDQHVGLICLLYSVDKPVTDRQMAYAAKHNDGSLVNIAQHHRKAAAAAQMSAINKNTDGLLKKMTVEIKEEDKRGQGVEMQPETIEVYRDDNIKTPVNTKGKKTKVA